MRRQALPQVLHDRRLQRERRVVAGDRHRANRRGRSQICRLGIGAFANDEMRRALSVSCASGVCVTAGDQDDRAAGLEHACVGFGDHLKTFHDPALCYPCAHRSTGSPPRVLCAVGWSYADTHLPGNTSTTRAGLAREISIDHPNGVHMVCVLKGAFMFLADFVRTMTCEVTLDFMAVSSYGLSTRSSGQVRL